MHENISKPNLAIHEQNGIILKRNNKHHKLFLGKLKNYEGLPRTHRVQRKMDDDSEDPTESQENSRSNTSPKEYGNILAEEERVHNSFQRMLDMYPDYEDMSYESRQHDVYNPGSSSSNSSKSSKPNLKTKRADKENKEEKEREREMKYKEVFEPERSMGVLSVISKSGENVMSSSMFVVDDSENTDQVRAKSSNLSIPDESDIQVIERLITSPDESNLGEKILKDLGRLEDKQGFRTPEKKKEDVKIKEKISTVSTEEKTDKENNKKEFLSPKKPLVPKVNIDFSKERKMKKVIESNRESYKKEEQSSHSEALSLRKFEKPNRPSTERDDTYQSARGHLPAFQSLRPDRNSSGEKIANAISYRSVTQSKQKQQGYWPFNDKKAKDRGQTKESKSSTRNDSATRVSKSDESSGLKKSVKSLPQSASKKHLGINLQSCFSRDKGNCIEQLTITQAPKHGNRIGKGSMPKLSSSPRSPVKIRVNKGRRITGDNIDNYYVKSEKKTENVTERLRIMKRVYGEKTLYSSVTKSQSGASLGRSKTEEALLANISERSMGTDPQSTLTLSQRQKIFTNLKSLTAFTISKQRELMNKLAPKESTMPEYISLTNFKTQIPTEHNNSLGENPLNERMFHSTSKMSKNTSVKSLHKKIKMHGKGSSQKSSAQKTQGKSPSRDISDYLSLTTRRTTAVKTSLLPQSQPWSSLIKDPQITSVPISPKKNSHLNLVKKHSDAKIKNIHDPAIDNSYGFWTSRSSRGNLNDNSHSITKGLPKTAEGYLYTEGLGNIIAVKDCQAENIENKTKGLKIRKVVKVNMFQEFKLRENEMLRNIKKLKPNYLIAAWPKGKGNRPREEKSEEKKTSLSGDSYNNFPKPLKRVIKSSRKKE